MINVNVCVLQRNLMVEDANLAHEKTYRLVALEELFLSELALGATVVARESADEPNDPLRG